MHQPKWTRCIMHCAARGASGFSKKPLGVFGATPFALRIETALSISASDSQPKRFVHSRIAQSSPQPRIQLGTRYLGSFVIACSFFLYTFFVDNDLFPCCRITPFALVTSQVPILKKMLYSFTVPCSQYAASGLFHASRSFSRSLSGTTMLLTSRSYAGEQDGNDPQERIWYLRQ